MKRAGSSSSEPESNLLLSSTDFSSPLHQNISEIHDILGCLLRQVPSLQDPTPHDTRTKDNFEGAYSFNLSHIQSKYPKANKDLLSRLGNANWTLRRQLISFRTQDEEQEVAAEPALNVGSSVTSEDNDNDTVSEADASQYSNVKNTGLHHQLTDTWTAFSENGLTLGTVITSMDGDPMLKMLSFDQPVARVEAHRLKLPRSLKPNSGFEGKQFRCPYCSYQLVKVVGLKTWKLALSTVLSIRITADIRTGNML